MAGFYKVVLRGVSAGQEINNILYYAAAVPTNETFSEDDAEDLGTAVNAAWKTQLMPQLSTFYAFQGCDVSMVNEDGEILSPFVVSVSDTGAGGQTTAMETPGMVLIAKFNCTSVSEASPHPVPRRSYLAVGPITPDHVGTSGILTTQATWQPLLENALTQGHTVGLGPMYPYRVGRTYPPSTENPSGTLAGVGRVHSVVCRPYISFRRSRLFSPTGN